MRGRFGALRTVLAVAGTAAAALAACAPAAVASTLAAAAAGSPADPSPIGGPQLAGRGVIVNYSPGPVPKLPGIKASAWVLADAGTGQVLAAKNPHGWFRPASTLKVLTAISLIPALDPDATTVASKQATSVSPNIVGLLAGHAYKISDLFTALLTISANDAAVALTQATGSYARGMATINAEARHLRAGDTVAVTPNGLDAPGQHTSAYDLALFGRQALTMPAFMKYDQVTSAQFKISKKKSVGLWNQNSLLATYPGALGGKIGWTSAAGATYVGMAKRGGHTLVVTLLHCPALTEITAAKQLLNWGFKVDGTISPVGTLVGPQPSAVSSPTASPAPSRTAAAQAATRDQAAGAGPSVLAAAGFSAMALVAAGLGFAYSRRQRPARAGDERGRGGGRRPNPFGR
ncbi:MAG TPA: serine hydrolase [Streptosporangiaceae bacterium]|nr:serine hydrolase [Streptosporangiaceae bacterium]